MLIPYPGDKSKIANYISPSIPKDAEKYIEPFSGMFGFYFSLAFSKMAFSSNVYSDSCHLNFELFQRMRYHGDFLREVKRIKLDEERYELARHRVSAIPDSEGIYLDYLISLCCGSEWKGPVEFDVFKMKFSAYKYHIDRISSVENRHWRESIEAHDSRRSFFYINPGADKSADFHAEMAAAMRDMSGKAMLSISPFDGFAEIYHGLRIERIWTISGEEYLISR